MGSACTKADDSYSGVGYGVGGGSESEENNNHNNHRMMTNQQMNREDDSTNNNNNEHTDYDYSSNGNPDELSPIPNGLRNRRSYNNNNNNNNNHKTGGAGGGGGSSVKDSILRVGSRILKTPMSPAIRASNYNHVQDAVAINFKEIRGKDGAPLGIVGIQNMGNTCYLNSSLQCLSATIPLTDYFLGYDYRSELNKTNPLGTGGKLATEYAQLMKTMWFGNNNRANGTSSASSNNAIAPVNFKKSLEKFAPKFKGNFQHDSQELLSYLLDGIHEDLNRIKKKPYIEDRDCDGSNDENDAIEAWKNYLRRDKSLVVDLFQGQLRNELQCLKCGHKNIRFEPFMYLSLPIADDCRSIRDCLELYLEEETMYGDNQWYCSKCKKHRDANKKTDLWVLPPILIIHLKRFRFNEYGHLGSKNTSPIRFPINHWDLSKFVKSRGAEKPIYDLYAVSNHVGQLGGGHYTAYAQNRFDDKWYEFNDSQYRPVTEDHLKSNQASAYVLFYNRTSEGTALRGAGGKSNSPKEGRLPLIRRQSVSRPDLWPHTQVLDSQFREFSRSVKTKLPQAPLMGNDGKSAAPYSRNSKSSSNAATRPPKDRADLEYIKEDVVRRKAF